jgi:phage terminase large subunit-like protein
VEGRVSESALERYVRTLGPARVKEILAGLQAAAPDGEQLSALHALAGSWRFRARPEQLPPPGGWTTWLILAGRGFGKTRTGAETALDWIERDGCRRLAGVAPTASDTRDVMVEGESGLLACANARGLAADYEPSKRRITFANGALVSLYSAEEPDRLRGPQHDAAWCDELAAWADPKATWDQLQFGLRLGARPRSIVTTTPRPIPLVRELMANPTVHVTTGSTYDNSRNLAPSFIEAIRRAYEGTRLGEQEIFARILDDNPGALWRQDDIAAARLATAPADLKRIVVGVDPAVSSNADSDLTGIVVAGVAPCRCKGSSEQHAFVVQDASGIYTPDAWARKVASVFERHRADRVIAEKNQGGQLVESNLRTLGSAHMPITLVTATRGKAVRAEPIAALYEQRKVHHCGTGLGALETQMCQWNPIEDAKSPDRVDALVWALSHLMLGSRHARYEAPGPAAPEARTAVDPWITRPEPPPSATVLARDPRRPGSRW